MRGLQRTIHSKGFPGRRLGTVVTTNNASSSADDNASLLPELSRRCITMRKSLRSSCMRPNGDSKTIREREVKTSRFGTGSPQNTSEDRKDRTGRKRTMLFESHYMVTQIDRQILGKKHVSVSIETPVPQAKVDRFDRSGTEALRSRKPSIQVQTQNSRRCTFCASYLTGSESAYVASAFLPGDLLLSPS